MAAGYELSSDVSVKKEESSSAFDDFLEDKMSGTLSRFTFDIRT